MSVNLLIELHQQSIICHINVGFVLVPVPAACLTLLVMSIERYQAIAVVRRYKLHLSTVRKLIAVIWLLAILSAIVPIFYARLNKHHPYECYLGRVDHFQILILLLVSLVVTSFLPIGIMLIIYVMILCKLIRKLSAVNLTSSLVMKGREKFLKHSILSVLFISIFSITSNIPYLLLNYYVAVNQYNLPSFRTLFVQEYRQLWLIASTLLVLTPIINPLLYNLASSKFRNVLYSLIRSRSCSIIMRKVTPTNLIQVESLKSSAVHSHITLANLSPTNESALQ